MWNHISELKAPCRDAACFVSSFKYLSWRKTSEERDESDEARLKVWEKYVGRRRKENRLKKMLSEDAGKRCV